MAQGKRCGFAPGVSQIQIVYIDIYSVCVYIYIYILNIFQAHVILKLAQKSRAAFRPRNAVSLMAAGGAIDLPDALPLTELPDVARNVDSPIDEDFEEADYDLDILDDLHQDSPVGPEPPVTVHRGAPVEDAHTRYASVIFMINSPPVHTRLPYGVRNDFYQAAARAIQIREDQIVLLHSIQHPPTDLELSQVTPMIAQIVHEVSPGSNHRYILLDVEFHAALPTLQPEIDRAVKLLPHQLTRQQLLQINAVHRYCNRARLEQSGCLLWINHRLIPEQHLGLVTLHHGDYVRIALPPDTRTCQEFSTREMAAICWTDSQLFTDLGAAGRPMLPQVLPQVPPDTSTVYVMPERIYDIDDEALLQTNKGIVRQMSHFVQSHPTPLQDITNTIQAPQDEPTSVSPCSREEDDVPQDDQPPTTAVPDTRPMLPLFEQRLHDLLRLDEFLHCTVLGGFVLVHTWYIDHHRVREQPDDRLAYLHPDPLRWRQQILDLWDDIADPQAWADFHIVHPPPRNDFEGRELHIIVTQTPDLGFRSVLLTLQSLTSAAGWRQRRAVAHHRTATVSTVFQAAHCDHGLPDRMHCLKVSLNDVVWTKHQLYQLDAGAHLIVDFGTADTGYLAPTQQSGTISPTIPFELSEEEDFNVDAFEPSSESIDAMPASSTSSSSTRRVLCLLELLEHTIHPDRAPPQHAPARVRRPQQPVTVLLDPIIPRPSAVTLDQVDAQWWQELSWKTTVLDDLRMTLHPLPEGLKIPPVSYGPLCAEPINLWSSPTHLEFHMDGSADHHGAGWSIVVIATSKNVFWAVFGAMWL